MSIDRNIGQSPQLDSSVLLMPAWQSVTLVEKQWDVMQIQMGFASQSMDCSALYKSIASSEDKSSVNFPGIVRCEMYTASRVRLSSG